MVHPEKLTEDGTDVTEYPQLVKDVASYVHDPENPSSFFDNHPDDQWPYLEDVTLALDYLKKKGILREEK